MRRHLVVLLLVLAIAGLLTGVLWWGERSSANVATRPSSSGANTSFAAIVIEQRAAVDAVVAAHNRDRGKDEAAFVAAGWRMASSPPPDMRVVDVDPSLIAVGREPELRTQLASAVPQPRAAHRMAEIAVLAHDPETRESAVDALSRLRTPEAEEEMIRLLTSGKLTPDDAGRRQLAALVQPTDLDDDVAARMAGLLDAPELTASERKQIAFTLALVGLRDGMALPARVADTLSPEAAALIEAMTALARRGLVAHAHASPEGGPQ
jgi:hypothetical protein